MRENDEFKIRVTFIQRVSNTFHGLKKILKILSLTMMMP